MITNPICPTWPSSSDSNTLLTMHHVIFKGYPSLDLMKLPPEEGEILKTDSSPLVVEHPSFPARTSAEWLKQHGLKGSDNYIVKC